MINKWSFEQIKIKDGSNHGGHAITIQQVAELFNGVMKEHGLSDNAVRFDVYRDSISFQIERCFGVSCSIHWRNDYTKFELARVLEEKNPELSGRVEENNPVIEIGWSSMIRATIPAMSAIDLYQKMTVAAADFETRLSEIGYIYFPRFEDVKE